MNAAVYRNTDTGVGRKTKIQKGPKYNLIMNIFHKLKPQYTENIIHRTTGQNVLTLLVYLVRTHQDTV
jgi:spore coat polysaccharide biosynthesis predicted glycosyltransferase SpsG